MQLQQEHPLSAPADDFGPAVRQPTYTRLKGHISEASPFNLVGKMDFTRKDGTVTANSKAGTVEVNRNIDEGAGNQLEATRYRASPQKERQSPFIQALHQWETPNCVCFVAWTGQPCLRGSKSGYDHSLRHPQPPSPEPPTAHLAPSTPQKGP